MSNYVNKIPRDVTGEALQEFPAPVRAKATYQTENNVASSVISLTPNTTSLEVGAFGGQGVVIRWVANTETASVAPRASVVASGAGANFDHWVPTGAYRRFAVPKETIGQMAGGQVGSVNGLYQRVALINAGATAASVLLVEY
jgi:hypothetical protein